MATMMMTMKTMMIFSCGSRVLTSPYLCAISPQIPSNHLLLTFSITLVNFSSIFFLPTFKSQSPVYSRPLQYWSQTLQLAMVIIKAYALLLSGVLPLYIRKLSKSSLHSLQCFSHVFLRENCNHLGCHLMSICLSPH